MSTSQKRYGNIEIVDKQNLPFFMVKNEVVTEYMTIIGDSGFYLYGFYKQMANRDEGDTLYPSLQLITSYLGLAENTISCYNWLLECCELLNIKSGDPRTNNLYTILPVNPVTPELLAKLTEALQPNARDGQRWAKFKANRLKAVQEWKPLRAYFNKKPKTVALITKDNAVQITTDESNQDELAAQLVDTFKDSKLSKVAAIKMIEQYGVEAIMQQLTWLPKRETDNPLRTLRAALKDDWTEPKPVEKPKPESFTQAEKTMMMANMQPDEPPTLSQATIPHNALWQEVKERIQMQLAQASYDSWVKQTELVSIEGNSWLIQCESVFAQEWLENRLNGTLTRTAKSVAGQEVALKFVIKEDVGVK